MYGVVKQPLVLFFETEDLPCKGAILGDRARENVGGKVFASVGLGAPSPDFSARDSHCCLCACLAPLHPPRMAKSGQRVCRCTPGCGKRLSYRQRCRHYKRMRTVGLGHLREPSESDGEPISIVDQGDLGMLDDRDVEADSSCSDSDTCNILGDAQSDVLSQSMSPSEDHDAEEEQEELERERQWVEGWRESNGALEDEEDSEHWLDMIAELQRMAATGEQEARLHDIRAYSRADT